MTQIKKVTFATLNKYAKKGRLSHKIIAEFSGMIDGKEWYNDPKWVSGTTLGNLEYFKTTKNQLSALPSGNIELSNCCFKIEFRISDKQNEEDPMGEAKCNKYDSEGVVSAYAGRGWGRCCKEHAEGPTTRAGYNALRTRCNRCNDVVHPAEIGGGTGEGICIHCEREKYPHGIPLDCDIESDAKYNLHWHPEAPQPDSTDLARCENCHQEFPEDKIRCFMCEKCNWNNGYCYGCEDKDIEISSLMNHNEKMIKALKEVHKRVSHSEYEYNKHLVKVCDKAIENKQEVK